MIRMGSAEIEYAGIGQLNFENRIVIDMGATHQFEDGFKNSVLALGWRGLQIDADLDIGRFFLSRDLISVFTRKCD